MQQKKFHTYQRNLQKPPPPLGSRGLTAKRNYRNWWIIWTGSVISISLVINIDMTKVMASAVLEVGSFQHASSSSKAPVLGMTLNCLARGWDIVAVVRVWQGTAAHGLLVANHSDGL